METLQDTTQKITQFINQIGITCEPGVLAEETFIPGIKIENGKLIYEEEKMLSPGDLLHEAGHLAVLKPSDRNNTSGDDTAGDLDAGAAEMAAIAWSWAALTHLDIAPEIVFHPKGYKGGSDSIISNFSTKNYFGACTLQWLGLTIEKENEHFNGSELYPVMKNWLRTD